MGVNCTEIGQRESSPSLCTCTCVCARETVLLRRPVFNALKKSIKIGFVLNDNNIGPLDVKTSLGCDNIIPLGWCNGKGTLPNPRPPVCIYNLTAGKQRVNMHSALCPFIVSKHVKASHRATVANLHLAHGGQLPPSMKRKKTFDWNICVNKLLWRE